MDRIGRHIETPKECILLLDGRCPYFSDRFLFIWQVLRDFVLDLDGDTHSFPVYRSFHCLFENGYVRGAEDSGDTTSLRAVAMASVLRAFLHGMCNFRFQQVEVLVLCLERHCS